MKTRHDHDACGVGFIAHLSGNDSREVVDCALLALQRLNHRGGVDADGCSGDGAGLLTEIPREFFRHSMQEAGCILPERFAVGMCFLPPEESGAAFTRAAIEAAIRAQGLEFVRWREVPVAPEHLGPRSAATRPTICQFFAGPGEGCADAFPLALFFARKAIEATLPENAYICSLSDTTIVYKGLLVPWQLPVFYPDLASPRFRSRFAVFHQRYSTNTSPSWRMAQPFRFVAHNGEINTIGSNRRWMRARQNEILAELKRGARRESADPTFAAVNGAGSGAANREAKGSRHRASTSASTSDSAAISLLEPSASDSASFDNAFEVTLRRGFSAGEAMLRMTPPAWEHDDTLSPGVRRYLQDAARQQEPWDGPAALIFSDGRFVGARLDRNGLRPLRYVLTADGFVIAGSETGIADLSGKRITCRSRLGPGEMILADPQRGEFFPPAEIASALGLDGEDEVFVSVPVLSDVGADVAGDENPTVAPLTAAVAAESDREVLGFSSQIAAKETQASHQTSLHSAAVAFGLTQDQYKLLFRPLVESGKEATFSMGDDAPPAVLSTQRRLLWDYFKQRFAQVTNPPIDSLRETQVMSLAVFLGRPPVQLQTPLLDDRELIALENRAGLVVQRIDIGFTPIGAAGDDERAATAANVAAARAALDRIRIEAERLAARPQSCILLTDRGIGPNRVALPVLLAISAAWNGLLAANAWRTPLLVETGQVWDTHHVAMCVAAGACAVHPYLAWRLAAGICPEGPANFRHGVAAGLRKVLAKMGVSTLASYRNGHLFETLGLDEDLVREFFEDAEAQLSGTTFDSLIGDALVRHAEAWAQPTPAGGDAHANSPALLESSAGVAGGATVTAELLDPARLRDAGLYRFRHGGELHSASPDLIRRFHAFVKSPTPEKYGEYAQHVHDRRPVSLRDLLELRPGVHFDGGDVEPERALFARFSTQAMSLGAISPEAHRVLATAMNRLGGRSNTGEGGEDPDIYIHQIEANNRIKQVASARFGVTANYLVHADELEIKMAQGSKPGEGGQLPPNKVTPYIARLRHAVPGMALISPPPHHDIYSIEDLAQLIHDLKAINPNARIGVKLVSGAGVGIIAAGVAKAGADVITISGFDGGTGASPLSSIKNTGLPWEIGLRDAHTTLERCGFRSRVRLRVDGGFKSGRDVVMAALLGADEFGFGTSALLAVGCIMARQCHLNTCPVGIATQDEKLRGKFAGTPESVMAFFQHVAGEVRATLARIGAHSLQQTIGRVDLLQPKDENAAAVIGGLLDRHPRVQHPLRCVFSERPTLQQRLVELLDRAERTGHIYSSMPIANSDRSVGARLSGEVLRKFGPDGLDPATFEYEFKGSAGQSFGVFLARGIRFTLRGDANDYVGKGLSGGEVVITAGPDASRRGDVLIGNTALYGATSGELYVAGRAGERFAVRNSGALAVVEGAGRHACEYMTAGVVLVLGPTGANFGSGMTGGVAYVLRDWLPEFRCHEEYVAVAPIEPWEEDLLRETLERHFRLTGSYRAGRLLSAAGNLALMRVQPLRLPQPLADTWAAARIAGAAEPAETLPAVSYTAAQA
jgi:glutamate synthase (ferredoxin)